MLKYLKLIVVAMIQFTFIFYSNSSSAVSISELQSPVNGNFLERRVTLRYGADWVDYCGGLVKLHTGTDVAATAGERVFAAEAGRVRVAQHDTKWGGWVTLEHAQSFTTVYFHVIPDTALREGAAVERGAVIGTIADGRNFEGADGRGFGTHLHFGVRLAPYSNISNRGALPQQRCAGDPPFAEDFFVDPMSLRYANSPPTGVAHENACKNVLDRSSAVPQNYGAPFNFFATDRELFFEAFCRGGPNVEIVAGHNYPQQYTYINGFHWNGSRWVNFQFNGPQRQGDWFAGRVSATIPTSSLASSRGAQRNWFVAYTCWNQNGQWRCGCDTPACPERLWQVQGFGFR